MSSFWDRVAGLPGLSPVIDFQAEESHWARYITRLHLLTLERGIQADSTHRFLDHGCGVGRITGWLAPRVAGVVGIDTSLPMLEEARRRSRHRNMRFEHIDGGPATLPHHDLDGVTSIWVLQHILDDELFGSTLEFFARAVRPGGSVYCIDRLCREPVDHGESNHLRLRTRDEYCEAFQARGFSLRACHPVSVNEQVLGRPGLTGRVQRGTLLSGALVRLDLAWARRQQAPLVADSFWHWQR